MTKGIWFFFLQLKQRKTDLNETNANISKLIAKFLSMISSSTKRNVHILLGVMV